MKFQEHRDLLMEACLGNKHAVDFLLKLGTIFRVWDDTWDRDRPVTPHQLDTSFSDLCFELSRNPFFKLHRDVLEAQIAVAWNAWHDSNEWWDDEDPIKQNCAWFIRDYCNELVQLCAWIIGGKEHMRRISLKVREAYLQELVEADLKEVKYGTLQ
ncbi:MAG: hypothetical protein F9K48_00350 [Candidatus Brocadia sp.]|nr:MAG: hypothetical protein F9K48_00350 [Candidatus Brocadia sp.]